MPPALAFSVLLLLFPLPSSSSFEVCEIVVPDNYSSLFPHKMPTEVNIEFELDQALLHKVTPN